MQTTLDLYKELLDNDDDLYDLLEELDLIIKDYDKNYHYNFPRIKTIEMLKISAIFQNKDDAFKISFINIVHKLSRVYKGLKNDLKSYENEVQKVYRKLWSESWENNDPLSQYPSVEFLTKAQNQVIKPAFHDAHYSLIGYLRVYNLSKIFILKDVFPENISGNLLNQVVEIIAFSDIGPGWRTSEEIHEYILILLEEQPESISDLSIETIQDFVDCFNSKKAKHNIYKLYQGKYNGIYTTTESIGQSIDKFISKQTDINLWIDFLKFIQRDGEKTSPTKKWLNELPEQVKKVGIKEYNSFALQILEALIERLQSFHKNWNRVILLHETNEAIVRGILFSIGNINDVKISETAFDCAVWSYKKLKDVGCLLQKVGSAALIGFTHLPYEQAKGYLTNAKSKIKYPKHATDFIEKQFIELAKSTGKSPDEIADSGIPSFGFDAKTNAYFKGFGDFQAIIEIVNNHKIELKWLDKNGRILKSTPSAIKTEFADLIKNETQIIKKAQDFLPQIKTRIEEFYVNNRTWKYANWKQYFIENGLVSYFTKKLIWFFEKDNKKVNGIFHNNQWIDNQGVVINWIDDETNIQLWHPLGFGADYVLQWRNFLTEKEILQPFKQAFREIYILTDAEINTGTYSNRFAAHILKNYQFGALCKLRNWLGYNQFHDGGVPELKLKKWNIRVQFWVEFINTENWGDYITSDQVKYYKNGEQLQLLDVPAIVFSETMRDVDLFVGVCSIGNDPTWQDRGNNFGHAYWQSYSFGDLGELAKTRKEILEKLLPRLKIAKIAEIRDKFLVIKGKIRTYKIHLGSGNILMEPNDQYLCIVPDRSFTNTGTEKVFLPFEGDSVLSIILSKAFLLAEDDKITDTTITRQLS